MQKNFKSYISRYLSIFAVLVVTLSTQACGQASSSAQEPANKPQLPKPGKTVFRDSDGNEISNNEFVDIRMANFQAKDATKMALLEDGTVEFRLQPVPQEGALAPPLSLTTIDGRILTADDLKGKVLVLNFWFIGCPGCLEEMPMLNAAMKKFGSNENVLFIALTFDPKPKLTKFLAREKFDYLMVAGAESTLNRFHFSGYPKNIVIGKDGKIVYWRSTISSWDKFDSVIQAEINKN
ncbi:MAG: TlpA disulfide reductase family protein [Pyrinomonadaceae bacterium]